MLLRLALNLPIAREIAVIAFTSVAVPIITSVSVSIVFISWIFVCTPLAVAGLDLDLLRESHPIARVPLPPAAMYGGWWLALVLRLAVLMPLIVVLLSSAGVDRGRSRLIRAHLLHGPSDFGGRSGVWRGGLGHHGTVPLIHLAASDRAMACI